MSRPLIVIALALALNGPAYAQTEREHGVHVHGRSQVNLAVDHERIELELTAPGMDIVGFEHEARDDAQQRAIDAALAILNDPGAWLAFEPVGACTPGEVNAHTHGYAKAEHHDHGHDHGDYHGRDKAHDDRAHGHDDHEHAHDHDHDHDHDEHAEFHLRLHADCTDQPRAIHLRLREHFPGIELLRVDLVTPDAQDRVELRHGQTRVRLQP